LSHFPDDPAGALGEESPAAAGFVVTGLASSLARGVELSLAQISNGRALAKLKAARLA
jgi:anthranilate phosphoribosyltransferase